MQNDFNESGVIFVECRLLDKPHDEIIKVCFLVKRENPTIIIMWLISAIFVQKIIKRYKTDCITSLSSTLKATNLFITPRFICVILCRHFGSWWKMWTVKSFCITSISCSKGQWTQAICNERFVCNYGKLECKSASSIVELAWHSFCVMDCHATAHGSIPSGNGVKTKLTSFARDSEWGCRL